MSLSMFDSNESLFPSGFLIDVASESAIRAGLVLLKIEQIEEVLTSSVSRERVTASSLEMGVSFAV